MQLFSMSRTQCKHNGTIKHQAPKTSFAYDENAPQDHMKDVYGKPWSQTTIFRSCLNFPSMKIHLKITSIMKEISKPSFKGFFSNF